MRKILLLLVALLGCAASNVSRGGGALSDDSDGAADRIRAHLFEFRADADRLDASSLADAQFFAKYTTFATKDEAEAAVATMQKLRDERQRFEVSFDRTLVELDRATIVENRASLRVTTDAMSDDFKRFLGEYFALHGLNIGVASRAGVTAPVPFVMTP